MSKSRRSQLWTSKDLRWLAETGLGYLLAGIWPPRWDPWLVNLQSALFYGPDSWMVKCAAAAMTKLLGPALDSRDKIEIAREHWRMCLEDRWISTRDMHKRPWPIQIEVEGIHLVEEGLRSGRGVIVWGMLFCGGTLAKAGLWQAGIRLTQLLGADHGAPSKSRLARRWLSPIVRRTEARYVDRTIVIPNDRSVGYLRELTDCLSANACLWIVGEMYGGQNVEVEFFGEREAYAAGAPWLAHRMGSALMTCYVVREASFRYRLVIEPVEVDRRLDRPEFVRAAVGVFADRVKRQILRHPADWHRWCEGWWRRRLQVWG